MCVVKSGKDSIDFKRVKAVIISYDLIKHEKFQIDYEVVIVDESHYLKNTTAQRTAVVSFNGHFGSMDRKTFTFFESFDDGCSMIDHVHLDALYNPRFADSSSSSTRKTRNSFIWNSRPQQARRTISSTQRAG